MLAVVVVILVRFALAPPADALLAGVLLATSCVSSPETGLWLCGHHPECVSLLVGLRTLY